MTSTAFCSAARLLAVGFSGTELDDDLKALLDRGVSGVVLFRRNIESVQKAAELISSIRAYAPLPIFVAVDQEGDPVERFREGFLRLPPMRQLGNIGDAGLAYRTGRQLGLELRQIGVDVNFAPVLDVDTNPENPVIGVRSFGSDPALVAEMGVSLGRGLQDSGVAACGKHFPGHGDTDQDSHVSLPRLRHDRARLERVELVPFAAWARANMASVMTAHVVFEKIDPNVPATMCPAVLRGILRSELGYQGVIFADDMEMKAIADNFGVETAVVRGLEAGVDSFLCCKTASVAHRMINALDEACKEQERAHGQLFEALGRVEGFTRHWSTRIPSHPPEASADLALEVRERSSAFPLGTTADPTEMAAEDTRSVRQQKQQAQE